MDKDPESTLLLCPICKEGFNNNDIFQDHFLNNHVEPSQIEEVTVRQAHKCPICGVVVKNEIQLLKHGLVAHKDLETDSSNKGTDALTEESKTCDEKKVVEGHSGSVRSLRPKRRKSYNEEKDIDIPVAVVKSKKRGRPPKSASKSKAKKSDSKNCSHCDYSVPNKDSLVSNDVIEGEKGTEDILQKAFCDCFCVDVGISKNHKCGKQTQVLDKSMECMYCSFRAKTRQIVREHVMLHHKEQIRPCSVCDYIALSQKQLNDHNSHKHNIVKDPSRKWPCNYCSFKADSSRAISKHVVLKHKELGIKCSKCNYITMSEKLLCKHVSYKHNRKQNPPKIGKLTRFTHQCEYCSYTEKIDKLVKHRLSHHKDKVKTYNCPSCCFESHEQSILNGHIIIEHTEHSKMVNDLICCPQCNYTTTFYLKLKSHYRRCHRDIKPVRKLKYRCELDNCDYANENLKEYNEHRYTVHGIKPLHSCLEFNCEFVGKNRLDLRMHLESVHNLPMKMENHEFASERDYIDWIRSIETETCSRYVQHSVYLNNITYVCNRSGRHYIPEKEKAKGLKKKQNHTSLKSGITCTSIITGIKQPDGHIKVEACLTHYGHELSVEILNLAHKERKYLEEKLLAGESYAKIISDIRNDLESNPNTKLQRLHMVGKSYLTALKIKLRKNNIHVPKVSSKKKESANAKHSFDKALANRIEHKLSVLKSYTSDLSSSSLLEIDKKLSALDDLVGGLPALEKQPSSKEEEQIEDGSETNKKKVARRKKKPSTKDLSEELPKQVYVEAQPSEEFCINQGQQQQQPQQLIEDHHQQMTELEPSRPSYFDLSQAQFNVIHTVQPTQGYTTNYDEFGHYTTG